jgi:hypothetical protein
VEECLSHICRTLSEVGIDCLSVIGSAPCTIGFEASELCLDAQTGRWVKPKEPGVIIEVFHKTIPGEPPLQEKEGAVGGAVSGGF